MGLFWVDFNRILPKSQIRKKADIQQIVWHLDVGLSFPKSVLPWVAP